MLNLTRRQKTEYNRVLKQLGGNDNSYQAVAYLLCNPQLENVKQAYINWEGKKSEREALWEELSVSERMMLRVALSIWGIGEVRLADIMGMDLEYFKVFQNTMLVLVHGLEGAIDAATPAEVPEPATKLAALRQFVATPW